MLAERLVVSDGSGTGVDRTVRNAHRRRNGRCHRVRCQSVRRRRRSAMARNPPKGSELGPNRQRNRGCWQRERAAAQRWKGRDDGLLRRHGRVDDELLAVVLDVDHRAVGGADQLEGLIVRRLHDTAVLGCGTLGGQRAAGAYRGQADRGGGEQGLHRCEPGRGTVFSVALRLKHAAPLQLSCLAEPPRCAARAIAAAC
jgi:hypothetical protein